MTFPKVLHREELDAYVVRRLNLPFRDVDWTEWDDLLRRVHDPQETVRIALVGKYVDLSDAYLSVSEALRAAGFKHRAKVEIRWVGSDDCETTSGAAALLDDVHGVLIPGGFGIRGIEGKIGAIRYARSRGLPVLGAVPGLAVHRDRGGAFRRHLTQANSAEFDPATPGPGHLHHGRPSRRSSPARPTSAAPCGWARIRRCSSRIPLSRRHISRPRCLSGIGIATRSTTPTGIGSQKAA